MLTPYWESTRNLRPLPYRVVYALAGLMELRATLLGGEPMLTCYTAAILAKTQTYNIEAARRDLGYEPVVSVAEGVERTPWQICEKVLLHTLASGSG